MFQNAVVKILTCCQISISQPEHARTVSPLGSVTLVMRVPPRTLYGATSKEPWILPRVCAWVLLVHCKALSFDMERIACFDPFRMPLTRRPFCYGLWINWCP